jgi:hypothetical protein
MPRGGPGQQKGGERQCKVCAHPGRVEIEAMLLNGASYTSIISRMKAAYPGWTELYGANLSRHKSRHLLTKPIQVKELDPETGEVSQGYIVGHLSSAPLVPKDAIPAADDRISVPDALAVIINVGLRNALNNPELVTIKDLMAALELARKLGLRGDDSEEFRDAWAALSAKRGELKQKARRRKVTVTEETVEVEHNRRGAGPEVIDAEVVTPDDWTEEELKELEAPDGA